MTDEARVLLCKGRRQRPGTTSTRCGLRPLYIVGQYPVCARHVTAVLHLLTLRGVRNVTVRLIQNQSEEWKQKWLTT